MKGVTFNKQTRKWRASLRGYGRNGYIGEFATEHEARDARRSAEVELHGAPHQQARIYVHGDIAGIPIMAARGRIVARAIIDAADLPLVEGGEWCRTRSGYAVQRRGDVMVYMHRLICPEGDVADHIDGDKMNNRRNNLRPCTQAQNSRNRRRLSKNNRSGVKGVSLAAGPGTAWRARIWKDRKEIHLGRFPTREAAAAAYAKAAKRLHGEFASEAK